MISRNDGENVAALSSNRDLAIVYVPKADMVSINLGKINASNPLMVSWMNPASEATQAVGTFQASGTQLFSRPTGWEDAILVIKAKGTAPGWFGWLGSPDLTY